MSGCYRPPAGADVERMFTKSLRFSAGPAPPPFRTGTSPKLIPISVAGRSSSPLRHSPPQRLYLSPLQRLQGA
jgi:hypothetical protein